MSENIIEVKSFEFAVRIVKLYQYITNDKKESNVNYQNNQNQSCIQEGE